jgi:hypothetical protein
MTDFEASESQRKMLEKQSNDAEKSDSSKSFILELSKLPRILEPAKDAMPPKDATPPADTTKPSTGRTVEIPPAPFPAMEAGPGDTLRERRQRGERPILSGILNRLQDAFDLKIGKDQLEFRTDFARLLDLIPPLRNDETSKYAREVLRTLRTVSMKGDTLSLTLSESPKIPLDSPEARKFGLKEIKLAGNPEKQVSFTVIPDKDSGKATIKDIKGISIVTADGKEIGIREIKLDASGKKPLIFATVDNPATRPAWVPESTWPQRITVPVPIKEENEARAQAKAEAMAGAIKIYADAREGLKTGNFSKLADTLPIPLLVAKLKLQGLMKPPAPAPRR